MASLPDTSSTTPTPTPTPTPTKRLGEPSLGYRTATICALVLGGMVLLAFLVTLIAFRRTLINKCIRRRYYPKTPPSSSLPRSHSQYEQGSSDGGGTGSVRQMEKVRVRAGRRARVEVSPYCQQHQTLSAVIVGGAMAWPETGTGPGPDSGFEAGSEAGAGAGGGGGGGVRGSGETQNRRSQDSTTSSIQSTHTCASTLVVVPSTTTPSIANTSIGTTENGMKRRSLWQDIIQAFKGSQMHNPTNTIAAATTPTTTESPSAVVSRSASIVAVHHLPITTTIDASIAPSSPITPHQEAVIASAASVYSQAFSITSLVSPTNLPPIIYCPRERAELDQLRQKYPTAAPGYTAYRLPPPPTPLDGELTAPTSTIPMTATIATSGAPSRPRSRASTFGRSTSPTRVTFADMGVNSNTQRNKRTSSAVPTASHSNRTSVISTTTTIAPSLATTPISPRARQIPTSASLPTFLTSPFLLHNRPTTPALAPASTSPPPPPPPPAQTPLSSSFSRKPKTLRAFLPTIADPTQSENHISNYFTRNSRPYSPFSYPKIYAPSYGDVEDLPQISSIPLPTLRDSGAGVGSGFGGFGSGVSTTSSRNST